MQDIIPMTHLFKGILMSYSNLEILSKPNLIKLNELKAIQKTFLK